MKTQICEEQTHSPTPSLNVLQMQLVPDDNQVISAVASTRLELYDSLKWSRVWFLISPSILGFILNCVRNQNFIQAFAMWRSWTQLPKKKKPTNLVKMVVNFRSCLGVASKPWLGCHPHKFLEKSYSRIVTLVLHNTDLECNLLQVQDPRVSCSK